MNVELLILGASAALATIVCVACVIVGGRAQRRHIDDTTRCPVCEQALTSTGDCTLCAREAAELAAERDREWWS